MSPNISRPSGGQVSNPSRRQDITDPGDTGTRRGQQPSRPDPVQPVPPEPSDPENPDGEQGWVRINPGNSDWQFCLQTGSVSYNRSDLSNREFSYSGSARSLYFKPIAGGRTALVNGNPSGLKSGQYYLFTGSLQVKVTNNHKGAMGQWSVYISAGSHPATGKGKDSSQRNWFFVIFGDNYLTFDC
jgi:hypothetical protein